MCSRVAGQDLWHQIKRFDTTIKSMQDPTNHSTGLREHEDFQDHVIQDHIRSMDYEQLVRAIREARNALIETELRAVRWCTRH